MPEDAGSYSVAVRGRCMIAHSFKGEQFGPAQALHGCTYVVDAVCTGARLETPANFLVDICAAERALHDALAAYDGRNLDELPEFAQSNTTCERVARAVWERAAAALPGPPHLDTLRLVVRESDVAFVEYCCQLGPEPRPPAEYTVGVRGRFMAARTLDAERFGAARRSLHGGTFVVDALFRGSELQAGTDFLLDICLAEELVRDACASLHQRSIDTHPAIGRNATAGAIAEALWRLVAARLPAGHALSSLRLRVREHDEASAEFERALPPGGAAGAAGAADAADAADADGGTHTLVARGRCMIAHSFKGELFGSAQALHGCTYVVDARLDARSLRADGDFPCSRAEAEGALRAALAAYDRRNLDELAEFGGENTTCERVAAALWARVAAALPAAGRAAISAIEIKVRESDAAWVAHRRALGPPSPSCDLVVLVDLDSEVGDLDPEIGSTEPTAHAAPASGAAVPTGIVHRTALARLLGVLPHRVCAKGSHYPALAMSAGAPGGGPFQGRGPTQIGFSSEN